MTAPQGAQRPLGAQEGRAADGSPREAERPLGAQQARAADESSREGKRPQAGPADALERLWPGLWRPLAGQRVALEPLSPEHEAGLFAVAAHPEVWRWICPYPAGTAACFHDWMEDALGLARRGEEAPFATIDVRTGQPIGSTRYLTLRPRNRGLEIGWTWLTPSAWRTGANLEAKILLMTHAFEELGCMRVEFKTHARNERSRAALAALPAQFEGIWRKHRLIPEIGIRDSAFYSVIDDEWPAVRANLRRRLSVDAAA